MTDTKTDPLLGFSPDEIIVGSHGHTLADAALDERIQQSLVILRRPQHPEHVQQARAMLDATSSLDALWHAFDTSGQTPEVWAIAAVAWHLDRSANDADEAATHERDAANYRANDADRVARGLAPIHPYAWGEAEMAPGWEDRAVERAKREGVLR